MRYDTRIAQLRFFASFSVVLYHLWTLQLVPIIAFRPGWLGVPLFLELSMFLLLNRLDVNPSLPRYFLRRIKRIWPLYFISVIAVFLADRYYFHMRVTYYQLALHFAFVSFVLTPFSFNYLFWTLQLEEWAYLFIPLIHRSRHKVSIAYSLIMLSAVYSLVISFLPYPLFHLLLFLPPFWLGAYGWGILAYCWAKGGKQARSPAIFIIIIYSMYLFSTRLDSSYYELATHFFLYNLALPVLATVILRPPRVLGRATVFLGEVSYGIYVWTLLFQELFGLLGVLCGLGVAIATELPLRRGEILARVRSESP